MVVSFGAEPGGLGVIEPARVTGGVSNCCEDGAEAGSIGTMSYHTEPQFLPKTRAVCVYSLQGSDEDYPRSCGGSASQMRQENHCLYVCYFAFVLGSEYSFQCGGGKM